MANFSEGWKFREAEFDSVMKNFTRPVWKLIGLPWRVTNLPVPSVFKHKLIS